MGRNGLRSRCGQLWKRIYLLRWELRSREDLCVLGGELTQPPGWIEHSEDLDFEISQFVLVVFGLWGAAIFFLDVSLGSSSAWGRHLFYVIGCC